MKITTYECFAPDAPEAHVARDWMTLGAPDTTTAVRFKGSREDRIALLTKWAEAEGCTVTVGEPIEPMFDLGPADYYGGVSGRRTFD